MNDRHCISSSLYSQQEYSLKLTGSTEHGPCQSGKLPIRIEYDFWPPAASSWINRCHFWPAKDVVDDIVRNGCHFVPIGHPLGLHKHIEWRISFSQAEYKLVHSMNHCQFLISVYGLLQLFLKEVIDKQSEETSKLLHVFLSHEDTNFVGKST